MSDSVEQPSSFQRRLWHGAYGALLGTLLGMIAAGSRHASLVDGALFGAGVGFLVLFMLGIEVIQVLVH